MSTTRIAVGHLRFEHPLYGMVSSFFHGKGELPLIFLPSSSEESYDLIIEKEGIQIRGNIPLALSHLARLAENEKGQSFLPLVTLHEEPRYSYRGVLLDEARHYFGKEHVKSLLDLMWRLQLNRFHWHLSDDQGFRLLLEAYPRLKETCFREGTQEGWLFKKGHFVAGPYGYFYTEKDIQEIAFYAKQRGIEIVPEIDMPGHLSAILSAYPEYTHDQKVFPVPTHFGILDHTPCLGNPEARAFLLALVEEVAYLFKAKYFHLGFDEIKKESFRDCPRCQAEIKAKGYHDEEGLIKAFRNELREALFQRGVIPILWNDGLKEKDEHFISEVWEVHQKGNRRRAIRQINAGQKAVIAPFFSTYVSNPYSLLPLKKAYDFDPLLKGIKKSSNVLGAEICYWSEYGTSWEKFEFEFSWRAALIARNLFEEKRRGFKESIKDLLRKSSFYFEREAPINQNLMNPSFLKRFAHFLSYTKDVDWEMKQYD